MQKVILSLFCPVLVAIVVRIALFVLAFVIGLGSIVFQAKDSLGNLAAKVGGFETFVWDESWCFWVIVAIVTFIAEMNIWEE